MDLIEILFVYEPGFPSFMIVGNGYDGRFLLYRLEFPYFAELRILNR